MMVEGRCGQTIAVSFPQSYQESWVRQEVYLNPGAINIRPQTDGIACAGTGVKSEGHVKNTWKRWVSGMARVCGPNFLFRSCKRREVPLEDSDARTRK
jgi:hypothetical protein